AFTAGAFSFGPPASSSESRTGAAVGIGGGGVGSAGFSVNFGSAGFGASAGFGTSAGFGAFAGSAGLGASALRWVSAVGRAALSIGCVRLASPKPRFGSIGIAAPAPKHA